MKKIFSIYLTIFILPSLLLGQDKIHFNEKTWEQSLAQAAEEKKLIYLDCYTSWCGPCKAMDKKVFTDKKVIDFYERNFINYKMDMEKEIGPELAKRYNVSAYPTHLFINGDGTIAHRGISYMNGDQFIKLGEEAIDENSQTSKLDKEYQKGNRSKEFMLTYLLYLYNTYQDYSVPFDEYLETLNEEDLDEFENLKLLYRYTHNVSTKAYEYFIAKRALLDKAYPKRIIELRYFNIYNRSIRKAANSKDKALLEKIVTDYRQFMKGENVEKAIYLNLYIPYYRTTNEHEKMYEQMINYIDRFIISKEKASSELDELSIKDLRKAEKIKVRYYYESKPKAVGHKFNANAKNLSGLSKIMYYEEVSDPLKREAVKWLKIAIQIEEKFEYYNQLIKFFYKLNQKEEAEKYIDKAISLAKKEKYKEEDYEELLQIAKELKSLNL